MAKIASENRTIHLADWVLISGSPVIYSAALTVSDQNSVSFCSFYVFTIRGVQDQSDKVRWTRVDYNQKRSSLQSNRITIAGERKTQKEQKLTKFRTDTHLMLENGSPVSH